MEWKVVDTVISPSTGVSFSCIHSLKNLRLTLWYQADVYMPPGSIIIPFNKGVLINDKLYPVTVYNVTSLILFYGNRLKKIATVLVTAILNQKPAVILSSVWYPFVHLV